VLDIDRGWDKIQARRAILDDSFVSAGIHATEDGPHEGTTTAMVGAFHEFGLGVPQRAWLSTAIDDHRDQIVGMASKLEDAVTLGKISPERALRQLAQFVEDKVKGKIHWGDGSWPALSEATIAKKGSSKPLVDTGQLLQSIRGKVHMGGAG